MYTPFFKKDIWGPSIRQERGGGRKSYAEQHTGVEMLSSKTRPASGERALRLRAPKLQNTHSSNSTGCPYSSSKDCSSGRRTLGLPGTS